MSAPVYYSSLFNDYTDYVSFVNKTAKEEKFFLDLISKYTPPEGKIAEAGNGTSSLSVYLNKNNYQNASFQIDPDMKDLGEAINRQNETSVSFHTSDICRIPGKNNSFHTIFSYEVLETLPDHQCVAGLEEGLRIARKYVFKVPTIDVITNSLRGNERLRSFEEWEAFLEEQGFVIIEDHLIDGFGYFVITQLYI